MTIQHQEQKNEQRRRTQIPNSPHHQKWDIVFSDFLTQVKLGTDHLLNPKPGEIMLEVTSGSGKPEMVMGIKNDDAEIVFTERFEEHHSHYNLKFPFPDNTFDVVSCRLGFLFFPDMTAALEELTR